MATAPIPTASTRIKRMFVVREEISIVHLRRWAILTRSAVWRSGAVKFQRWTAKRPRCWPGPHAFLPRGSEEEEASATASTHQGAHHWRQQTTVRERELSRNGRVLNPALA